MSVSPAGAWVQRHLPDSQLEFLSLSLSMVTALMCVSFRELASRAVRHMLK